MGAAKPRLERRRRGPGGDNGAGRQDDPPPRSVLRVVGWNVTVLIAALVLIAVAGEVWLRLTKPFMREAGIFRQFVPGVGVLYKPGSKQYVTNKLDFWIVSRANRWGFFDREPPFPERAAASCHVTFIGDSFVEARQVSIADKAHVRLEALAHRRLPHLDVTTSAFGHLNTGQIGQLPFYDTYARRLRPKLTVLVFRPNDFENNSPILEALKNGYDPDRLPWATAVRGADGVFALRPPDPEYGRFRLPVRLRRTLPDRALVWMNRRSWFAGWLAARLRAGDWPLQVLHVGSRRGIHTIRQARELLSRRPEYAWLADTRLDRFFVKHFYHWVFAEEDLPPVFAEAMAATGFALDEFKARAARDGSRVVILVPYDTRWSSNRLFGRLHALAEARGIPIIDQGEYIVRQGGDPRDVRWPHDSHWSPAGHRLAAEALLEWLQEHQDVCGPRAS